VTNGGVRDLDEVRALGFHYFATEVLVSHAYVHLERVGGPVTVGGMEINPGDLIHADQHGVLIIPAEVAGEVAEAARRVEAAERPVIEYCQKTGEVDLAVLRHLVEAMAQARG
jgi:regulator of RNase E activity RraA